MEEKRNEIAKKIPPLGQLEERFSFIEDDILRKNISIEFQYIIFLIAILDETDIEGKVLASSVHKDMILHAATIVESCVHYCLRKYIDRDLIRSSDVMPQEWRNESHHILYKISDDKRVSGVVEHKAIEHLTDKTQAVVVNRAARDAGILTKGLFEKAETLRNQRNRIHLSGLQVVDKKYSKIESASAFALAKEVIERVEGKLSEIV